MELFETKKKTDPNKPTIRWIEVWDKKGKADFESQKMLDRSNVISLCKTPLSKQDKIRQITDYISKYHLFIAILGMRKFTFLTYYYNGKYWSEGAMPILVRICNDLYKDITAPMISEIIIKVQINNLMEEEMFFSNEKYVAIRNGLIDTRTGKIIRFDASKLVLNYVSVLHDPKATCPNFEEFLEDVLTPNDKNRSQLKIIEDKQQTKEDLIHIKEWIGFCLQPQYQKDSVMFLVGGGSNGKSLFLEGLSDFLGRHKNVSAVVLSDLAESQFRSSALVGKMANISGDIDNRALQRTDILKRITTGEPIQMERKGQDPFDYVISAKLIFSCNTLPATNSDDSMGFYRRILIVEFQNEYPENRAKYARYLKRFKKERSGILNLALKNLKNLNKRGKFDQTNDLSVRRAKIISKQNSVIGWIESDILTNDPNAFSDTQGLYSDYQDYCKKNNRKKLSLKRMSTELKKRGFRQTRRMEIGLSKYGYEGIVCNTNMMDQEMQEAEDRWNELEAANIAGVESVKTIKKWKRSKPKRKKKEVKK